MTTLAPPRPAASESLDPTVRQWWRRLRWPAVAIAALAVAAIATAIYKGALPQGDADPNSYGPGGTHALAQLLRDRGVPVERVTDPARALSAAAPGDVVVVSRPMFLDASTLAALAASPSDLVLLEPDQQVLDAAGLDAGVTGSTSVGGRQPHCEMPAARVAGDVTIGGTLYAMSGSVACYGTNAGAPLVQRVDDGRTLTLLGSAATLSNDKLAGRGNAALSLGLLADHQKVVWLVPENRAAPASAGQRVVDLLPGRLWPALWQLAAAVALIALWRARRLGPVVAEALPVVVRATETVRGRGRLYTQARARRRAAEHLRAGSRSRLKGALSLPPDAGADAVCAAVEARGGSMAYRARDLLYGASPGDDTALVALARQLDALEEEVRTP